MKRLPLILVLMLIGARMSLASKNGATTKLDSQTSLVTSKIESLVQSVGDFSAAFFDGNGDLASEKSKGPFEVIVNAPLRFAFTSCFDAKNRTLNLMRNIYSEPAVRDSVSRVLFSAPGFFQASLGHDDAKNLDWPNVYPTNFFKVLLAYMPVENEAGELNKRTWVVLSHGCE